MSETHADIWSEFDTLRAKLTAQARDVAAMWALIDRLKTRIETLEKWPDQLGNSLDKLDCYVARLELSVKETETQLIFLDTEMKYRSSQLTRLEARVQELETWKHDFVMNSPRGGPAGRAMKQE